MGTNKTILYSLLFTILFFGVYTVIIIWTIWPISEYSLEKAGVFGDSFGVLTSLFSGLAFWGMIATLMLQSDELRQQRAEIKKSADAQIQSAQLSAFTTLLNAIELQITDKEYLKRNPGMYSNMTPQEQQDFPFLDDKIQDLHKTKELYLSNIRDILQKTGINL